jgi:hypothetical protein
MISITALEEKEEDREGDMEVDVEVEVEEAADSMETQTTQVSSKKTRT